MALSTSGSSVTFGSIVLAACSSFQFSNQREVIDVSEIGTVSKQFIAGNTTATATCEIFYDQTATGHTATETYIASGTSATLIIQSATAQTYSASAFLTSFEITGSAGDVIRATCSFQITGVVSIA
jgi:hypothetical protein